MLLKLEEKIEIRYNLMSSDKDAGAKYSLNGSMS